MNFIQENASVLILKHGAVGKLIVTQIGIFLLTSVISVLMMLFGLGTPEPVLRYFELPTDFFVFILQPWSIVTYGFLHSMQDIFHLVFNMLYLFWFGKLLQAYFGPARVWQMFFGGVVFGGIMMMLGYSLFPAFRNLPLTYVIGASAGALSVLCAVATFLPEYQLHLMLIGPVKLKWIAIFLVVLDVISINPSGNTAHFAHLGGALFGFIAVSGIKKQIDPLSWLSLKISKLFKPKERLKVVHSRKSGAASNEPDQEEIDKILDKLAKVGYARLSVEEKQALYRASQRK